MKALDTIYEGENWVDVGGSISLACKIPMEEPFALEWSLNNETLDLSLVNFPLVFLMPPDLTCFKFDRQMDTALWMKCMMKKLF